MLSQFLDEEESYIKGLVDKISASGANVLICQKGIDDLGATSHGKIRDLCD